MKQIQLFLLFSFVTAGAWAQPVPSRDTSRVKNGPEHRRAELRSVLKEPRGWEAPEKDPDQRFENVVYDRHLSEQERVDLRQQLRRQRPEMKPDRP